MIDLSGGAVDSHGSLLAAAPKRQRVRSRLWIVAAVALALAVGVFFVGWAARGSATSNPTTFHATVSLIDHGGAGLCIRSAGSRANRCSAAFLVQGSRQLRVGEKVLVSVQPVHSPAGTYQAFIIVPNQLP
jgi:hypothetical protein